MDSRAAEIRAHRHRRRRRRAGDRTIRWPPRRSFRQTRPGGRRFRPSSAAPRGPWRIWPAMKRGLIARARTMRAKRRRQRPRPRPLRIGDVEHDEIGCAAEQLCRRGKAADEGCVLAAFEQVAAGVVAGMHQRVGVGDRAAQMRRALRHLRRRRRHRRAMRRQDKPRRSHRCPRCGRANLRRRNHRRPARCRRCDRDGPRPLAVGCTARGGERIFVAVLIARRDRLHGGVDERDLRREQIAEQSGNAPGDIDARTADGRRRQHFDAGDAAARRLPDRPATHQRKSLRDLFAAGAQRGAAPQIDHHCAHHLAVGLQMRAHDLVGGEPAELHRRRRRQGARIGGEEVAAGRQHVAPPARRRAGRPRRDAAAVERCEQRRALSLGACSPQRIVAAGGGAAIDVQAVLDGEVLEIAQPGVDAAQRLVGRERGADAGLARQTGALRRLDDQRRQPLAPPPVEAVGLRIFIDQTLELSRVAGQPAVDKRRRQMADGQRRDAALGLRRLARIADDERIDHRQRAGDDLGKAFRGERDRLARQPFQRAVRAHVHERIDLGDVLQPQAERDQRMARRQLADRDNRRAAAAANARDRAAARPKACRIFSPGSGTRRRAHRRRPPVRPKPRAAARWRRLVSERAGAGILRSQASRHRRLAKAHRAIRAAFSARRSRRSRRPKDHRAAR